MVGWSDQQVAEVIARLAALPERTPDQEVILLFLRDALLQRHRDGHRDPLDDGHRDLLEG
jgi:hypothetical protein